MTRETWLQTQWSPYPAWPTGVKRHGRVGTCSLEGAWGEALPYLREGDWVAVLESGELLLLAPALATALRSKADVEILKLWGFFLHQVRAFFFQRDFVELQTPIAVTCPGTEPSLDYFSTEFVHGSRREKLFLRTSPELHLKKALTMGFERIFELGPVFRNGEITDRHQPEFQMIEWYRSAAEPEQIKEDVMALIQHLAKSLASGQARLPKAERRFTVAQLFRQHLQFELQPETSLADFQNLVERAGLDRRLASTRDDAFFLLMTEKIEPQFDPNELTLVENYPPFQAALARTTADGWGDRFEFYWQGFELANAFHELNDPRIQSARFADDLRKKTERGGEVPSLDPEFQQALESGLPPAVGIALGLERLFMAMFGVKEISRLRLFPRE